MFQSPALSSSLHWRMRKRREDEEGQKFRAKKEMFLGELETFKKTLENSRFNLKRWFLEQVNNNEEFL